MNSVVFVHHSVEGCAYGRGPEVGILAFSIVSIFSYYDTQLCCSTGGTYLRINLVVHILDIVSSTATWRNQSQNSGFEISSFKMVPFVYI